MTVLSSNITWHNNQILLIGTVHNTPEDKEKIINTLDSFKPSTVLFEGNRESDETIEAECSREYKKMSGTNIKALQTIPIRVHKGRIESGDDINKADFKRTIPRKMGRYSTIVFRYLLKYSSSEYYWNTHIDEREDKMCERIITQIEDYNTDRVAVIVGKAHVIGLEKLFNQLD